MSRTGQVKGLTLSEKYFREIGRPRIERIFPDFLDYAAVGLVGEGSECFGFDDEISRDHDWGPGFCIWLQNNDYEKIGTALKEAYEELPAQFLGFERRHIESYGGRRTGVFSIENFYWNFLGIFRAPSSWKEWIRLKENDLAVCTNGAVFIDRPGAFSEFRTQLLDFYPKDIQLKKMAARCMSLSQYGQYQFRRCVQRSDYIAAQYAQARFSRDAMSLLYLMNSRYMPYFKWAPRGLLALGTAGEKLYDLLEILATETSYDQKCELIYLICDLLSEQLRFRGFTENSSDYLADHAPELQGRIKDKDIRALSILLG